MTTNDPTYRRSGAQSSNYHYRIRGVTVSTSGHYTVYSSSSFPTKIYLYVDRFHPFTPTTNLVVQDQSDANGTLQFTFFFQGSNQPSKRVCIVLFLHMVGFGEANRDCSIHIRSLSIIRLDHHSYNHRVWANENTKSRLSGQDRMSFFRLRLRHEY